MKVPINLANRLSNVDISANGNIEETAIHVGAQLGAIEAIEYWGDKYADAVIVKVVSCEKHPNADKLSLCKIDDGRTTQTDRDHNGLVQVICGAPNIKTGQLVVWLPPGSIVPATFNDPEPFILGSRELRGTISAGMIASPSELSLSDDHDGILVISEQNDELIGTKFKDYYGLSDIVLDLENKMFTHRPDCFGILGVARELAGIQHKQYASPAWYLEIPNFEKLPKPTLPISVSIETKLVPRLMAVAMSSITVGESHQDIKSALLLSGIKPINNVVDVTNYLMQITGQPLHAYDYDKVLSQGKTQTANINANLSEKGQTLKLLNGKTIVAKDGDSIFIYANNTPIGVGGVMGGSDTEVDDNTKNIILECASFDMYSIRKTSMKYGLFTDAVTRFNKGQSILQNDRILKKAMEMISELCGGTQASDVADISTIDLPSPYKITVESSFINDRLGSNLSAEEISKLLNNVEFISKPNGTKVEIEVPFWRTDIELPEDILEEVGRLYGFDKLTVSLPERPAKPVKNNTGMVLKQKIRSILSSAGANEVLTYSFVHGNLLEKAGQSTTDSYQLSNAISPELQYYRQSLLPSLIDKISLNLRSDYIRTTDNEFSLFEINKVHIKNEFDPDDSELPNEFEHLACVFAADNKTSSIKYSGSAYYASRKYLDALFVKLNQSYIIEEFVSQDIPENLKKLIPLFAKNRLGLIVVNSQKIGLIGEFSNKVENNFKLPKFCSGFELSLEKINQKSPVYIKIPKFPKIQQDITIQTDSLKPYLEIKNNLYSSLQSLVPEGSYFYLGYPSVFAPENSSVKNVSFKFWIATQNRTLKSEDVNKLLDSVATKASFKRI